MLCGRWVAKGRVASLKVAHPREGSSTPNMVCRCMCMYGTAPPRGCWQPHSGAGRHQGEHAGGTFPHVATNYDDIGGRGIQDTCVAGEERDEEGRPTRMMIMSMIMSMMLSACVPAVVWVSSSRVPKEREGRERMRVREIEGERGKGEREGKGKGIGEGRRGREKGER